MKNIIIIFIFFSVTLQARVIHTINNNDVIEEQRVALVIGNNDYTNLAHLKNPVNDARLMRDFLKMRGFSVIYKENADKKDMRRLLKEFAHEISKGGIGFYYFAGHSVNVNGKINLVGVDSSIDNRNHIEREVVVLNNIIKKMRNAHNRLNIIVLDTCRNVIKSNNHHYARGVNGGLTTISNTKGIFLASATADGEVARDGKKGSYGILTKHLVLNLNKGGATLREIFKKTRSEVYEQTDSKKPQGIYNQIKGDYLFIIPPKREKKQPSKKISSSNKIVKDKLAGRIWQKSGSVKKMNWSSAKAHCLMLSLDNNTNWRLPTIKELKYLANRKKDDTAMDMRYFNAKSVRYWSGTEHKGDDSEAWGIDFYDGVGGYYDKSNSYNVRCVVGGQ